MKNNFSILKTGAAAFALAAVLALASCTSAAIVKNQDAWPEFYTENPPASVLVMPPINQTNNVDAKDYFYYTLQAAMANNGYYSFPPILSYETLQAESAYDAEMFIENDIAAFRRTFGADLLLFTRITNWKKHPVGGIVDVEIEYILRSTSTGNIVYQRKVNCACDTSFKSGLANSGGILSIVGLVVDAIGTAVKTAATDYTIVARGANNFGIDVPKGKYSPYFMKDYDTLKGANPGRYTIQSGQVTDNWLFAPATLTSLQAKGALVPSALAASASAGASSSSTSSSSGTSAASSQSSPAQEAALSDSSGSQGVPENSSVYAMMADSQDLWTMTENVLKLAQSKAGTSFPMLSNPYAVCKTSSFSGGGRMLPAVDLGEHVLGAMVWGRDRDSADEGKAGFYIGKKGTTKDKAFLASLRDAAESQGWKKKTPYSGPYGRMFLEEAEFQMQNEDAFRAYLADYESASAALAEILKAAKKR